jgi:hypothetical protein
MFRRFVSGFKPGRDQRDEHSEEGAIAKYILVPSVVPECLPNEAGDQLHDADRRAVRDNAACPQMLWYKSAANAETRESATAASGLKEGQQVRLDDVCVGRGHAVRQILVGLQRAVLQRPGRQWTCVGERNNLVAQLRDETDHAAIHP